MLDQLPQGINPLSPDQAQNFEHLLNSLSPVQQAWVSGYLAARVQGSAPVIQAHPGAAKAQLTILYGSQTGNAKHVASDLAEQAKARGMEVNLVSMADYKHAELKDERFLTIVVSTYGEGEPPESAERLYNLLGSKKAPRLDGAQIAVLGLGDSSYEYFCQTAIDFEERLSALGAEVVIESALFDVDYDDHTPDWIETALGAFKPLLDRAEPQSNVVTLPIAQAKYGKKNPFEAEVSLVQKITGRDSTKDVRHVEVSLEGSGITYQPGDALGVYFHNDIDEIDTLLEVLRLDSSTEISVGEAIKPLRQALIEDLELTQSYPSFVERYAAATNDPKLVSLSQDKAVLRSYLSERQVFDILRDHPHPIAAQTLVDCLRKAQPRLYSIASSQAEVEDEVHLTVGVVEWDAFGHPHVGGASGHLGRRISEGDGLRVFVEDNNLFRLPPEPNTPVIMIGPGTGIAPFRAFLQERDAMGAAGKNWLFFGNPNFTQDFLYQTELQSYLKSGLLTRLDVAFSRDQADKIYVQDRLIEKGAELWRWLEDGAHIYVCGDANRMAKDVHSALLKVIEENGIMESDTSKEYISKLQLERRYNRDIY